ncbi:UrcA family protein [Altererythrobacter sp. MF3-039]|uniref:UrcA family protein n=1 Tax=Altererythrobacter sp. MF3-039 TaxID=3252901 RepID=UPI00390CB9E7
MIRITALFAPFAALLVAQPAAAQTNQASLSYDTAELTTPEGAKAVYKRIAVSAKHACEVTTPLLKRDQYRCQRELTGQLVEQIRSPILLALHEATDPVVRLAKAD